MTEIGLMVDLFGFVGCENLGGKSIVHSDLGLIRLGVLVIHDKLHSKLLRVLKVNYIYY